MTPATPTLPRRGVLRHSRWDALLIGLALAHGAVLAAAPVAPVIAVGVWWNSNTIAHNFIHTPFFRNRLLNRGFALYLSALLGIPQSVWRGRHLAHHAGAAWKPRLEGQLVAEVLLVLGVWSALLALAPAFFVTMYLPGYAAGLGLSWLQGYYEHARGTVSHYGLLYNTLFFNDGYHAEHHAAPGTHWTRIPGKFQPDATRSAWPAVLRWLDAFSLEGLERLVLHSPRLQRWVVSRHERAFRRLLPPLPPDVRVGIVGGGLFPRTLLVLQRLLPDARFVVIDRSAENLATARRFLRGDVQFVHECFDPGHTADFDLLVFPLAFVGDREGLYRQPPARLVVVHDWLWRRRGKGVVVSRLLLKRLNLVCHESDQSARRVRPGATADPARA
jgi:hypothetical protein